MERKQPELPRLLELDCLPLEPDFAAFAALCKQEERPMKARRVKGTVLTESRLKQVTVERSLLSFANFDGAKGQGMRIQSSRLDGASLTQCELKTVSLEEVDFTGANFFHTPLEGLDFTSSTLEGIQVSSGLLELRGAIVTAYQAAGLAGLMGLVVK